jgi:tRNA1Val (adenine37-N6)-methyltransferase
MTEKRPVGLLYPGETLDELRHWNLRVIQSKDGYRFGIDSLLLASLANPPQRGLVLDMGTGCGVLSLILARRFPNVRICAIEIQRALMRRAKRNTEINGLSRNIRVVEGSFTDLPQIVEGDSFDYVITNPPYYRANSGRRNPNSEKAIARHEIHGDLGTLLENAFYALKFRGRLGYISDNELLELIAC